MVKEKLTKTKPKVEKIATVYSLGRRKTAIALAKVAQGTGKIYINQKEITNPSRVYTEPLKLVNLNNKVDCSVKVYGGGISSQEEAIRLAFARAILKINPDFKKTLKVEGFLTRDPRMKERKKPGLKGARRAPQWQKR